MKTFVLLIVVALLFRVLSDPRVLKTIFKKLSAKSNTEKADAPFDIKGAYQTKWMFTQHEKQAYYRLKEIADKYDLLVFAKVRLFDLVDPVRNHPKYKSNLYRIQAKHVDFVLTKKNLVAKYVVELNDSSHNAADRKERDEFVSAVLSACGYKVLMVNTISEETLAPILQMEKAVSAESV